jgi:hypothetical protein
VSSPDITSPAHAPARSARRSGFDVSHAQIEKLAPLVYLAVLLASAFAAYWAMFSEFASYDDSGFFIHSIRLFSEGRPLYNQVFTDYGPFSYEVWAAVFGLAGHTISTDSGRLAIVGLWLLTSLLLGVSSQRLTGRLTLGVIVQVLSFSVLTALNAEPMHASGMVCLLFAATVAVVSFVLPTRLRVAVFALGALVAALALTKINIGGFAAISVAYATVMALPSLQQIRALRWLAAAALVAVGPILMWPDLTQQWAQNYSIIAVAGTLAVVLTTELQRRGSSDDAAIAKRWLTWLIAGFALCAAIVVGVVLAAGTTLGAMWQEIVVLPTHQGTAFTLPISLSGDVVYWATGAVAAAWIARRLRATSPTANRPHVVGSVSRILASLAIWLSIVAADPLDLSPENANFALAMVLAWVAAIPSTRDDGSRRTRFVRLFLPAFAVLEALQAYPVAGTQVMFGSLLLLVCGAVCFADGWADLEAWGANRDPFDGLRVPRTVMTATATALVVALAFAYVVRPLESWGNTYSGNSALPIPSATRLHLPASQVATFTQIVAVLQAHCDSLITLPGLLSFNLWSGLPAPSGLTAEPFWSLLSHTQERSALASAKAAPGLCAVHNEQLAENWDGGTPPPSTPLVSFIEHDFTPIGEYEGYVVSTRS